MKIVVDIGGCDHPENMVRGAVDAAKAHSDYGIVISGDRALIEKNIQGALPGNVFIEHAPDVITNNDSPTQAIRQKPDSSLIKGVSILKSDDEAIGLVSAGSTGAVLTAATLLVGRLKGVHRPVLASLMPTLLDGKLVCVADCGANVDSKPEFLPQFALMAHYYIKAIFGIDRPVVGLLSVGTEDKKGDERTKAAFPMLKALPINFVGNMEARDTLTGKYDIVVCDGFAGNVLTKSTEGTAKIMMKMLKQSIMKSFKAKLGAMFMKSAINDLKTKMDYHKYGGAAFLGVNKLIVKDHGSATEVSTCASVNNIIRMHEHNIIREISDGVSAASGGGAESEQ